jgi:hypothetical protein
LLPARQVAQPEIVKGVGTYQPAVLEKL